MNADETILGLVNFLKYPDQYIDIDNVSYNN